MVLAELWEFSQAEEGKGCGENQRETFLNLEWQGVSLEWSYCPWAPPTFKEYLANCCAWDFFQAFLVVVNDLATVLSEIVL